MKEILTAAGYKQTKDKLTKLQQRLATVNRRTDLNPQHLTAAQQSYKKMIAQYLRELKLYEAAHPEATAQS